MSGNANLLDDEITRHYALIGQISSTWAFFEMCVDVTALQLAKVDMQSGICFTAQISGIGRKLDAYIALARHKGAKKTLKQLNKIAETARSVGERRNRVIHDPWTITTDGWARLEITAKKSLFAKSIAVPTSDLFILLVDIAMLFFSFEQINLEVLDEISSLQQTQP